MRKLIFLWVVLGIVSIANAQENIFSGSFIKSIINRVNEYQRMHPWTETDYNWIRGTYYTGVMAAYQATGERTYLDQCNTWGEKFKWQLPVLRPDQEASGLNLLTCGQTWIESYLIDQKKYKISPVIQHLENSEVRNPVSTPLYWYFESGVRYADGLFTGPPTLAMLFKATGEEKYLNWMDACFWDVYGALYDIDEGLFYRDVRFKQGYQGIIFPDFIRPDSVHYDDARRSYVYQMTLSGKKVIWSRGNGWVFAGLARIMKYLPSDHANYGRYKALFIRMANELKKRQQPDGFWYPNLADPDDFHVPESSGTGFFTYGMAWGINQGILPEDEFRPTVEKAWEALVSVVTDEGKVGYGQLVGASPYRILQEDSHEYVTGTFLLAASEMYKIAKQK